MRFRALRLDVDHGSMGAVGLDTLASLRANRGLGSVFMFPPYVCNSGLCSKGDKKPDSAPWWPGTSCTGSESAWLSPEWDSVVLQSLGFVLPPVTVGKGRTPKGLSIWESTLCSNRLWPNLVGYFSHNSGWWWPSCVPPMLGKLQSMPPLPVALPQQ